jgi:hypothetical protein
MSISSVLLIVTFIGAYKLGYFNATHPGQIWVSCKTLWKWMRT